MRFSKWHDWWIVEWFFSISSTTAKLAKLVFFLWMWKKPFFPMANSYHSSLVGAKKEHFCDCRSWENKNVLKCKQGKFTDKRFSWTLNCFFNFNDSTLTSDKVGLISQSLRNVGQPDNSTPLYSLKSTGYTEEGVFVGAPVGKCLYRLVCWKIMSSTVCILNEELLHNFRDYSDLHNSQSNALL